MCVAYPIHTSVCVRADQHPVLVGRRWLIRSPYGRARAHIMLAVDIVRTWNPCNRSTPKIEHLYVWSDSLEPILRSMLHSSTFVVVVVARGYVHRLRTPLFVDLGKTYSAVCICVCVGGRFCSNSLRIAFISIQFKVFANMCKDNNFGEIVCFLNSWLCTNNILFLSVLR